MYKNSPESKNWSSIDPRTQNWKKQKFSFFHFFSPHFPCFSAPILLQNHPKFKKQPKVGLRGDQTYVREFMWWLLKVPRIIKHSQNAKISNGKPSRNQKVPFFQKNSFFGFFSIPSRRRFTCHHFCEGETQFSTKASEGAKQQIKPSSDALDTPKAFPDHQHNIWWPTLEKKFGQNFDLKMPHFPYGPRRRHSGGQFPDPTNSVLPKSKLCVREFFLGTTHPPQHV